MIHSCCGVSLTPLTDCRTHFTRCCNVCGRTYAQRKRRAKIDRVELEETLDRVLEYVAREPHGCNLLTDVARAWVKVRKA